MNHQKQIWETIEKFKIPIFFGTGLFIYLILVNSNLLLTLILTGINAVIVYIKTREALPVDFAPTIFCAGIIAAQTGIGGMMFFVIAGVVLPTIITGFFGPEAIIFWGALTGLALVGYLMSRSGVDVVTMGIIITILKSLISLSVNIMLGNPLIKFLMEETPSFIINMILYLRIAELLI